jgi:uncharacterized protein
VLLPSLPAVVITGARQTGTTTLVRELLPERGRLYLALDDIDLLEPAERAPDDLVAPVPSHYYG